MHEPWREVERLRAEVAKLRFRNSELESDNARLRAQIATERESLDELIAYYKSLEMRHG